jgi:hypothetical protein
MNPNSSTETSHSSHLHLTAEEVSRRAYELWEQEGRPEQKDLHHWLRAEQELRREREGAGNSNGTNAQSVSRPPSTDVRPLQGTRAAAAAGRDNKRGTQTPFGMEKSGAATSTLSSGNKTDTARRRAH